MAISWTYKDNSLWVDGTITAKTSESIYTERRNEQIEYERLRKYHFTFTTTGVQNIIVEVFN